MPTIPRAALAAPLLSLLPAVASPQPAPPDAASHAAAPHAAAPHAAAPRDSLPFDSGRLAEGVYAVVRRERTGLYFQSNAAFIVGDSDVVVVDAQFSQGATREVVDALRRITSK